MANRCIRSRKHPPNDVVNLYRNSKHQVWFKTTYMISNDVKYIAVLTNLLYIILCLLAPVHIYIYMKIVNKYPPAITKPCVCLTKCAVFKSTDRRTVMIRSWSSTNPWDLLRIRWDVTGPYLGSKKQDATDHWYISLLYIWYVNDVYNTHIYIYI